MSLNSNSALYDVVDTLSERMSQKATSNLAKQRGVNMRDVLTSQANYGDIYEIIINLGAYQKLIKESLELAIQHQTDIEDADKLHDLLHTHFEVIPEYFIESVRTACYQLDLFS